MTHRYTCAILASVLSAVAGTCAQLHAQEDLPTVDKAAKPVVEHVNRFYRGLEAVSCTAEVHVKLGEGTVDDRVAMRARAVRPNKAAIISIEPHGYFPTNQFVSNGKELFEWSIRRRMFMISEAAKNFQGLFHRAATRSAPNMPVEVFLAMMSEQPMQNLLRLDVEPGLIRLVGEAEIDGVRCHELVVNEKGSRAWVRVESPPWLMRYRNSPKIALPRYLPKGVVVTGPNIQIDFKNWLMVPPTNEKWDWIVPEGNTQMATMHESDKGGPEDGYTSLNLVPGQPGNRNPAGGGAPADLQVKPGVRLNAPLPEGPNIGSLAPEVELISIGGERQSLSSVRKDRPAVLVFWIDKNKASRASVPNLMKVLEPFAGKMAIIPIGSGQTEARVLAAARKNRAFAGSFVDAGDVVSSRFDVPGVTAVILLDREGKVAQTFVGPTPQLAERTAAFCKRLLETPSGEKKPSEAPKDPEEPDTTDEPTRP